MKRQQRRKLKQVIEAILEKNTSMEYERFAAVISHILFIKENDREATEEEKAIALKKFEDKIEEKAQILKELPAEILEGEEDLKRVYEGYMSAETREKLQAFYKKIKWRWIF